MTRATDGLLSAMLIALGAVLLSIVIARAALAYLMVRK